MDQLQQDLENDYPELDVQILGVNVFNQEFGNASFTADADLPWLQDVDENQDSQSDVWNLWGVEERDVIILDTANRRVATYNLTANDLGQPANFDALKEIFLAVAESEQTSSVSGSVYFDVDDDGVRDASEAALGGVVIELTGNTEQGQTVSVAATTQADGRYAFQGLAAGTYTVSEVQPARISDGRESIGTAGGTAGNDTFTIQLSAGVTAEEYNFGERGRQVRHVGRGDFLSSTASNAILLAQETGTDDVSWYCLRGAWADHFNAEFEFPADDDVRDVVVSMRNTHGHTLQAERSAPAGMHFLGENNGTRMWRVYGPLIDLTALARAESNGDSSQNGAEGEALAGWRVDLALAEDDERDWWTPAPH